MNQKVEQIATTTDNIKLSLSVLVIAAGIVGFYFFENDTDFWIRLSLVIAAAIIGLLIGATSYYGQLLMRFASEASIEIRKVIWPTRSETVQTTIVVLIIVVILSIILWLLDLLFHNVIKYIISFGA